MNEDTIGDAYPIPHISDILDQLGNSKYFTTLDLASGYHQIEMHPKDAQKTAFSVPHGHYEFTRMPFGLKNAPSTFQRLMNTILSGLQGTRCLVYLDDIIIFADSLESHNKKLLDIFKRLRESGLKIKPSKCEFLRREVMYLGHKISEKGAEPDESKIEAVMKFPQPKSARDIKSFLGLAGYYRRFIENFSSKALPLTQLLRKDSLFAWGTDQEESFNILKECLTKNPILSFPNFEKPFNVTTDASNFALGAVLSQGDYPNDLPISYASRSLNVHEINYSTIEKELLAIVWSVKKFREYLHGRKFRIITDHRPLVWLFNIKDPNSRLVHWRLTLEEFDYEIIYKPGRKNANADALSRNPVVENQNSKQNTGLGDNETYNNFKVMSRIRNKNPSLKKSKSIEFNKSPNKDKSFRKNKIPNSKRFEDFKNIKDDVIPTYKSTEINTSSKCISDLDGHLVLFVDENLNFLDDNSLDLVKNHFPKFSFDLNKLEVGQVYSVKQDNIQILYLILNENSKLSLENLFNSFENLKLYCLKKNIHSLNFLQQDLKILDLSGFKALIRYIFEGTNITFNIIKPEITNQVNISLSYRRFRTFNQRNTIENNNYNEHHGSILSAKGPLLCYVTQNLEEPDELVLKFDQKFNHLKYLLSEVENKNIGDIIFTSYKGLNVYYLLYKENKWDSVEYDQLFDYFEILKIRLISDKIDTINIPILPSNYNNLQWHKIRTMLKFIFKDSGITLNVYKNHVINPSKDEIQKIISEYHASVTSGHIGIQKTVAKIKEKYYWPTIFSDTENFIKNCDSCQRNKLVRRKNVQPLEITTTSKSSFEKIFLDIVGPLYDTECENRFILTLQDDLTKYSQAYPLKNHTAETVADVFVREFVCKFGSPRCIITDQGTEFTAKLFDNVAKILKIKKYHATAYHPQSNGALERSHQTLADYLKHYVEKYKTSWDQWVDFAMFSYNTAPHSVTKFSPYELVFGCKPNLPTVITSQEGPTYTYDDYLTDLKTKLGNSFETAREHILGYKSHNKFYFDKKARPTIYKIGDKVLLEREFWNLDKSKKLQARYEGPYEVVGVQSPNCTIRYKKNKLLKTHFNRLKHYVSNDNNE